MNRTRRRPQRFNSAVESLRKHALFPNRHSAGSSTPATWPAFDLDTQKIPYVTIGRLAAERDGEQFHSPKSG